MLQSKGSHKHPKPRKPQRENPLGIKEGLRVSGTWGPEAENNQSAVRLVAEDSPVHTEVRTGHRNDEDPQDHNAVTTAGPWVPG